jgi:hypothetical protein
MSNHNVPIKIFASPRVQRSYDRRDEARVVDLIRREVLPKTKAAYHSISVKIRRAADGSPKSLTAYLLRQDTYTAEVKKIEVDQDYNVQAIQDDYDESQDPEDAEADDAGARYAPDGYGPVDFVAATPVPEIPTARQAVEHLHQLALNAGLRSRMLLGSQASVANYQGYLRSGVQGFVNIGHGFTGGIVLDDGTLSAHWFQSLPTDALTGTVIYFNSCQVFNPPLQPAVMQAGTRTFVGGIVNLLIGPSEEVCKCFWGRSLAPQQAPMGDLLTACEAHHYPDRGAHGIGGDLGQFLAGHVIVFQHIDFRGHHRHLFAMERNLNHPEDGTLNDQISSFVVLSGTWKFYLHADYGVPLGGEFPPGLYRWVEAVGVKNDQVSSLKCIRS